VLTGIGTVLEDDPRLDVREVPTQLQPQRVIVDSQLQTPPSARILQPPGMVWIYAGALEEAARRRQAALEATGAVDIRTLPDARGKVELAVLLADLAARGVNELHVEAGHKLNASLLRSGLVDELLVYLAPKLIGLGRGMAAFGPIEDLADALPWRFVETMLVGDDLRVRARPVQPGRA
jgi:diaminohydroxyphosphoribosylaminopyrimidine deaminase/5-amino-6-(5-phosphoribosylamino)uracil reductase